MSLRWFGIQFSDFRLDPDSNLPDENTTRQPTKEESSGELADSKEPDPEPQPKTWKAIFTSPFTKTSTFPHPSTRDWKTLLSLFGRSSKKPTEIEEGRRQPSISNTTT
jgi:hypothetical protein